MAGSDALIGSDIEAIATPVVVVDAEAFEHNLSTMAAALPASRCRPHVKAHKTTAIAARQRAVGHVGFTCATPRELVGMADAGLGDDLLLANQVIDPDHLDALAHLDARVTIAVDSDETIDAAAEAGLGECLIDVNVGMPRCGCQPDDAGRLADVARARGLTVRGVMGYEGHVVGLEDRAERERQCAESMALLAIAHDAVGGDIISAGGTGTFDCNALGTEIQAGSYALMDTAYGALDIPFRLALCVVATVISVNPKDGYAVADAGLKALGMDHGNPTITTFGGADTTIWYCADEHSVFSPADGGTLPHIGDRVRIWPAHIDPTIALHTTMHVVATPTSTEIVDTWPVDLRNW
jgi:D-serine deaminase-like pyridoxal phosphate-dependent protein